MTDEADRLRPATAGDRLDYIADMVRELRALAAKAGCETLSGILELAYREALRQRRSS